SADSIPQARGSRYRWSGAAGSTGFRRRFLFTQPMEGDMARYILNEEQREVVENALLLYESELEKLRKKPGLLTKEVNEHLAVLHGTEEEPGLLRIFAGDVPVQRDAFYDREQYEEDLDETLEGIEEEAERRIAARAEEEAG